MPEIVLGEADRLDWALKAFKKKMQHAGILLELRKRRHYVKPSAARTLKSQAAKRARDKAKRRARDARS